MTRLISLDLVEAYSLCPRKASLLLAGEPNPSPHEHVRILEAQKGVNCQAHRLRLEASGQVIPFGEPDDLAAGRDILADAELTTDGLRARCDFLIKVGESSRLGQFSYEAVKVIGTCRASKTDTLGLAYEAMILGKVQGRLPVSGTLIRLGDRPCKVKLAGKYKQVRKIVDVLRVWTSSTSTEPSPIILNKHCPICPFREACLQRAEKEDNLSLLDRMTPKLMRKHHDKGIFTVRQLSHVYKPRRSRKKAKRKVRHSLELQALAIRTGKIHVEHLPELPRGPVELFVDLEGVPDRDEYYLIGLLVGEGGGAEYESFWSDDIAGEAAMWSALLERLEAFPNAPLYHYGSYEKKAFATLSKRHGIGSKLVDRLVNVASSVYGKVYFPVRSNGLKSLGRFLGAAWTAPEASGLQSLVWRHRWEMTRSEQAKESLVRYNREDCEAVRLLVECLARIRKDAASDPSIEFASRPKRFATGAGKVVHGQFERILTNAHENGRRRPVCVDSDAAEAKKRATRKGHQAYQRIIPAKVGRVVRVSAKRRCPKGHGKLSFDAQIPAERTVIDLAFTRGGCRKTTTRYEGKKGYCRSCDRHYLPPALSRLGMNVFGHAFQAWTVYQRVILRLPYRIITQVTEHLFGVGLADSSLVNFLKYMADYYASTGAAILQAILKSDFVHVDETRINIQGTDNYVWVFTDGRHVAFRMTETREADIVREVLAGYGGVLVTDFYPGYDALPCRQQKCLVHLIRDINDDLWKAPFDKELEAFAVEVQTLLVPILAAIDRFGLKVRHLRKFRQAVERFYRRNVIDKEYISEYAIKYQKRFDRYRESLFTFLSEDGIPWENNMAERAIRQLAVQRKISGSFFKRSAGHYLLLLAISQTCRFQGKSFLKFLLSKETDLDSFKRIKSILYSRPVTRREECPSGAEGSAGAEGGEGNDVAGRKHG